MGIHPLVLDIAVVLLIIGCAVFYAHRGFVAAIVSFAGTLASFALAWLAARLLPQPLFDSLLRPGMEEQLGAAIAQQGDVTSEMLMPALQGVLPENVAKMVAGSVGEAFDYSAPELAAAIVDGLISPIVLPLLAMAVFLIAFLLLRLLVQLLRRLGKGVNNVPVIGGINRALGACCGVLIALLYGAAILVGIWIYEAVALPPGGSFFEGSVVYQLVGQLIKAT